MDEKEAEARPIMGTIFLVSGCHGEVEKHHLSLVLFLVGLPLIVPRTSLK